MQENTQISLEIGDSISIKIVKILTQLAKFLLEAPTTQVKHFWEERAVHCDMVTRGHGNIVTR